MGFVRVGWIIRVALKAWLAKLFKQKVGQKYFPFNQASDMGWGWGFCVPFGISSFFALQRNILNLELKSKYADTYLCGLFVRGALGRNLN